MHLSLRQIFCLCTLSGMLCTPAPVRNTDTSASPKPEFTLTFSTQRGGCFTGSELTVIINDRTVTFDNKDAIIIPRFFGAIIAPVTDYFEKKENRIQVILHSTPEETDNDSCQPLYADLTLQTTGTDGMVDTRETAAAVWTYELELIPGNTTDSLLSSCTITLPLPATVVCDTLAPSGKTEHIKNEAPEPYTLPDVDEQYFLTCRDAIISHSSTFIDTVDATLLRFSYAAYIDKNNYLPFRNERALLEKFTVAANDPGKYPGAAILLDSMLARDPVNFNYHVLRSNILHSLGDPDTFNFAFGRILYKSITGSGSGSSAKSPYRIVLNNEIEGFFRGGAIHDKKCDGLSIDSIRVIKCSFDDDGTPETVYFQNVFQEFSRQRYMKEYKKQHTDNAGEPLE